MDTLVPESDAGTICQNLKASLGLISSADQQDLVYNYLKNKNFAENVWLGIKKFENSFKSIDGASLIYNNWNAGRPVNQTGFDCVEISVEYQGKWVDVKCEKKNSVLCVKKQDWSNSKIESTLQELRKNYTDKFLSLQNQFSIDIAQLKQYFSSVIETQKKEIVNLKQNQDSSSSKIENILQEQKKNYADKIASLETIIDNQSKEIVNLKQSFSSLIEAQKNEIVNLKQNPVPIGFIYVQLSGQKDPQTLWPNTQWSNVSPNYAGLFFRAEGGNANSFGTIQEEQTQALFVKSIVPEPNSVWNLEQAITSTHSQNPLRTGDEYNDKNKFSLSFRHSTDEIRPRNQAIRIWIRIK